MFFYAMSKGAGLMGNKYPRFTKLNLQLVLCVDISIANSHLNTRTWRGLLPRLPGTLPDREFPLKSSSEFPSASCLRYKSRNDHPIFKQILLQYFQWCQLAKAFRDWTIELVAR